MALEITTVDAFTTVPFTGNPAAIAVVDAFPDNEFMRAVASEMNLSETAFVVPRADGAYNLRWFTPTVEVDLCGHATLAAAHVLGGRARFHTLGGLLSCAPAGNSWIEMDFPADRPVQAEPPATLDLPECVWYGMGRWAALAELQNPGLVRDLVPNLASIASIPTRALIVTAVGDRFGIDCVSRVFAPNAGIPEDPVTGSAHCTLAPYWEHRLGRSDLVGEQASPRGGIVRMRRNGDRVVLAGQAVTVSHVTLAI